MRLSQCKWFDLLPLAGGTLMLALLITSDCEPKPVSDTQLLLSECASPSLLCPFSSSDGCSDPEGDERLLRGEREEGCAGSTASTLGWLGPKLGWEAKLGGSGAVGSLFRCALLFLLKDTHVGRSNIAPSPSLVHTAAAARSVADLLPRMPGLPSSSLSTLFVVSREVELPRSDLLAASCRDPAAGRLMRCSSYHTRARRCWALRE
mmetsp:Transcript_2798/g.7317  ORF Transcript_2798/g.7317 Transcript_2798/m.7317 type:complete len:206 (+) Transcript_2798:34-651(+)